MSVFDIRKRRQEQAANNGSEDAYHPDVFDLMEDIVNKPLPPAMRPVLAGLTMAEDGTLMYGEIALTPNRLVFPRNGVTRETADALLDILIALDGSIAWMLGDMLLYQEKEYGVTYDAIALATGKEKATLYDYRYVAQQFSGKFLDRSKILSWTHHKVAASVEDPEVRMRWIGLAEQGTEVIDKNGVKTRRSWTVAQLRAAISGGGGGGVSTLVDKTLNYTQRLEARAAKLSRQERLELADEFERVAARLRQMEGK